ncbi:hypothetical protein [Dolosigranulum pigrum]|uniref:hypothetical protein n=1 Tax=Dolosigranulum pigrum TaxID=29394 RepID=UPI00163D6B17|nr:hypothetical protein [Dolosigranulum pigrum]
MDEEGKGRLNRKKDEKGKGRIRWERLVERERGRKEKDDEEGRGESVEGRRERR